MSEQALPPQTERRKAMNDEPTDEQIERWLEDYSNDKRAEGSFYRLVKMVWKEGRNAGADTDRT